GLMIVAGALIAFQSPINAALGRSVGVFEASLVSFIIGSLVAAGVVFFFGKGDVRAVTQVPWWQLLGGVLGLLYVTLIIVRDRKSTRLNSSHVKISYAVFCLKKKT